MTKNDKILLICCFIVGCIVTFFVSGCSKPKPVTYNVVTEETEEDTNINQANINDVVVVYTVMAENNTIIPVATCKGCHFECPHCEVE